MPRESVEKQERTVIPTTVSELMRRRREVLFGKGRFSREAGEDDVTIERHPTKRSKNSDRKVRPARQRKQIMERVMSQIEGDMGTATKSPR